MFLNGCCSLEYRVNVTHTFFAYKYLFGSSWKCADVRLITVTQAVSPQGSGASISANWWAGSLRSARPESTPSCDPGQCLHMKVNNMLRIIQFSIVFQIVLLSLLGMHLLNSANYNEMKKRPNT